MSFEDWDDKDWTVKITGENIELNAPDARYLFNEHDFLELSKRISAIAELLELEELDVK